MEIKDLSINEDAKISSVMEMLNKTLLGIGFVVNKDNILVGTITDGDIRRSLLKGFNIDNQIDVAFNREFVSLPISTSNDEILNKLSDKLKVIPLVGTRGELLDYASIRKIRRIPVAAPLLKGNELAYVTDCIRTNWISSQGKYVRQFEDNFKIYHNGYHALAVSNGTVALHLALLSQYIGPGDEVIVPNLTFAASINAILYVGATPVLADVEYTTRNIDPNLILGLITPRTKAIMVVHLYGMPCAMNEIMGIAKRNNLSVIEDAAEAVGSTYNYQPVGTLGDVSTFSFFGNKTITTGEGGMILFKAEKAYNLAAILRDHGMSKQKRYWHDMIGYNYRLTNIQAAIGVAQMERLDDFVDAKRRIAKQYNSELSISDKFILPASDKPGSKSSNWLYTILVKDNCKFTRNELMAYLNANGVESRPVFYPLHEMPPYIDYAGDSNFPVSTLISKTGISLPSSPWLTKEDVAFICKRILYFSSHYKKLV